MGLKSLTLIFMTLLFASCLPEQSVREISQDSGNLESSESEDTSDATADSDYLAPYWYDAGSKYASLTIDYNNTKNHYLFGSDIHNYLGEESNFNASYCLYAKFNTGTASSTPLMVRATPATTINYSTGARTRYLRVNLSSSAGNENACNKAAKLSEDVGAASLGSLVYHASSVCSSCFNIIASEDLKLFKYSSDEDNITLVGTEDIPYTNLGLRIDMNGNSSGNVSSCTDAGCAAQGFDCCISGQCVNEGSVKTAAALSDPEGYALAKLEELTNPKWYLDHPEFYYICLNDPQNGGDDDTLNPEDPEGDAAARLESMKADYACIEELKENSLEDPFHTSPINWSLPSSSYTSCDRDDENAKQYYKEVMKRLYQNCGCSEKDDLDAMVSKCPAYTYKLVYLEDALGNQTSEVTSVACVTPANNDNDLPYSDLEVMVNSRSAPHRLFNESGVELNPYQPSTLPSNTKQEGELFRYLDNEKLMPLNGSFNMNSILGQMNVSLSGARPAKKVSLEFDKVYYIAALEGTYSACPSCAKDSWFTNFSPYPVTNQGHGIRATGFTTSRDSWGSNSSFGNYEDTIFGRACWVPPTMLPFGHSDKSDSAEQRLARLKTQASLYINGYQRDWFGFNKGALIGSFDGVTWFAIGKGRKVRSTSDSLYLAINAPFADLASPTDHIVSVQEYDFVTTAAEYDYHPEEEINSPFQNDGGLCQQYHQCETDANCISKLGWEYSCVDVDSYKTKWPKFDPTGAKEIAGDSNVGAIEQFLQQGSLPPGAGTKRCVYRGAGAPCRVNLEGASDEETRRALACAPNFYCASIYSADFNKEVARYGAPLESILDAKNHYFGQDANHLGRPKDYVITSGGATLPMEAKIAIGENLNLIDSSIGSSMGVCRPGKALPAQLGSNGTQREDQLEQHQAKDAQGRTDFISQISGCNATLHTSLRYSSCPMIGPDGNYLHLSDEYLNVDAANELEMEDNFALWTFSDRESLTKYYSTQQNMCGLEAINSDIADISGLSSEQLRNQSAFKTIEARDLSSSDVQIEPTLVQNACFRRAGSVCHTNYDCSPNYKHYEVLDILDPSYFGNGAERKFWEEYLVCGQGQSEPVLSSDPTQSELDAYNSYSMHNNRCCREVGKTLTLFTEDSPNAEDSIGLRTDIYGGFQPNNPNRYSRYVSSLPQVDDTTKEGVSGSGYTARVSAKRPNDATYTPGDPNILTSGQWRNIHDSAARTCCGGSWVRKFADGSNDWSKNRLNFNVDNFKCLNYKTPLMLTDDPEAYYTNSTELNRDRTNFCPDTALGAAGCAQYNIAGIDDFNQTRPVLNNRTNRMRIDTDPEVMKDLWSVNEWAFMQLLSYDAFPAAPYLDWTVSRDDIIDDQAGRQVIFTRIPTFIAFESINDIRIDMEDPTSNGYLNDATSGSCTRIASPSNGYNCALNSNAWHGLCEYSDATWSPDPGLAGCYYMYDDASRRLKVTYNQTTLDDPNNYENKANSLIIEFKAPGTLLWEMDTGNIPGATAVNNDDYIAHRRTSTPGNALYYLEKLAKLEYIGIPQMTYEPIFCNDIYQKVVPGIFKDTIKTANDFISHPDTFTDTRKLASDTYWDWSNQPGYNPSDAWTNDELRKVSDQELLQIEPVFSDNEFKCCLPLGSEISSTESPGVCCSGVARQVENTGTDAETYQCALPTGTDLNVYFNKYVSGEGLDGNALSGASPLSFDDFNEQTGAPKTSSAVLSKLSAIGEKVCETGQVTRGGFFGPFDAEPVATYEPTSSQVSEINSFVDSPNDNGQINNRVVGNDVFKEGYRWNHHVYCSPGN